MAAWKTGERPPILILLAELRAAPRLEGIKKIVAQVEHERCEYFNLRKGVERCFARPLTEEEARWASKLQ
jgi:hypothetical protein